MASTERIEELINPAALGQLERLGELTTTVTAQFEKLVEKAVALNRSLGGAGTFKQITKEAEDLSKVEADLIKQVTELEKVQKQAAYYSLQQAKATKELELAKLADAKASTEQAKAATESAKAAKIETDAKLALKRASNSEEDRNAARLKKAEAEERKKVADTIKRETQEKKQAEQASKALAKAQAEEAKRIADANNQYKQLVLQYEAARAKALQLGATLGTNNRQYQIAALAASDLKTKIRELDLSVGDTRSTIGRYNEGIKNVNVVNTEAIKTTGGLVAGVSKFYGFLRIAANIIPGLGISGIFLLAFEAIQKAVQGLGFFTGGADKAAEKTKKLNEETQQLIDNYRDIGEISDTAAGSSNGTIAKVTALSDVIKDQTQSYHDRNRALQELKEINKNYFGDLSLESASLKVLTDRVNEYIDAIINQAVIKELEGDIAKVSIAYNRQSRAIGTTLAAIKSLKKELFASPQVNPLVTTENLESLQNYNETLYDQLKLFAPLRSQYDALRQEITDATKAGLRFRDLDGKGGGGSGSNERRRQYEEKENNDRIKRFIELEKEVSAALEVELNSRLAIRQDAYSREFNFLVAEKNREIKVAREAAEDVLNDPKASKNAKLNAQDKLRADLATINSNYDDKELLLQDNFEKDYDKIILTARLKRIEDEKGFNKQYDDLQLAAQRRRIQLLDNSNQIDQDVLKKIYDEKLAALDDSRKFDQKYKDDQLKADRDYEHKKLQIETDRIVSSTMLNLQYYKNLLEVRKGAATDTPEEKEKKDKEIAALAAQVAALEAQLAAAQASRRSDKRKKANEDYDDIVKTFERIQRVGTAVTDAIGGIINAGIIAQKNALKDQEDQIEKNAAAEIEAVNNSQDAEEKKAARIQIINARVQAQKEAIERRQRQLDQQKAVFDKAKAIFDIILGTAVAVAKATSPFEKIFNAIQGAAQLAIAIATPIPRFATGTLDAPGGPAVVGDGGRAELVQQPDGSMWVTPSVPTVMNIPKGSIVHPDARVALEGGLAGGVITNLRQSNQGQLDIGNKLDILTRTVRDKTEWHVTVKKEGWNKIKKGPNGSTHYI